MSSFDYLDLAVLLVGPLALLIDCGGKKKASSPKSSKSPSKVATLSPSKMAPPQSQGEKKEDEKKDDEKKDDEKKDDEKKDGEKKDGEKKDGEKKDGEKKDGDKNIVRPDYTIELYNVVAFRKYNQNREIERKLFEAQGKVNTVDCFSIFSPIYEEISLPKLNKQLNEKKDITFRYADRQRPFRSILYLSLILRYCKNCSRKTVLQLFDVMDM